MYVLRDSDFEYRHGDHGPKYLMKGPRMSFGTVLLRPKDVVDGHFHSRCEENFYVLEGALTVFVQGEGRVVQAGGFIHVEPGEKHCLRNDGDVPCRFCIALSPYVEGDKTMADFDLMDSGGERR